MPTGFGIVGCGMISNFHAQAIENIRGAKVVACFDTFPEGAKKFAKKYDCTFYEKIEDMLADPAVDIVSICTPSGAHMEPAVAAAKAGKHVVVEKPLEITLKRCDRIIDACRQNDVRLCAIFPSRYSGSSRAVREAIAKGRFGKMTLGDAYVKWWRTQEYYDSGGWRGTWALDGGGAYMNQAIHGVDLLYSFMGDVAEVTAFTDTIAHERIEVEDIGVAALRFRSGALGTIEASTAAWPGMHKKIELHGTQGTVVIEDEDILVWDFEKKLAADKKVLEKFSKQNVSGGGASDPSAISYDGHMKQLKDFIKAVETGSKPVVDGEEGRKSVEIILAMYKSSWTGKAVQLPLKGDPKIPADKLGQKQAK